MSFFIVCLFVKIDDARMKLLEVSTAEMKSDLAKAKVDTEQMKTDLAQTKADIASVAASVTEQRKDMNEGFGEVTKLLREALLGRRE
jgi:hypothetical protein